MLTDDPVRMSRGSPSFLWCMNSIRICRVEGTQLTHKGGGVGVSLTERTCNSIWARSVTGFFWDLNCTASPSRSCNINNSLSLHVPTPQYTHTLYIALNRAYSNGHNILFRWTNNVNFMISENLERGLSDYALKTKRRLFLQNTMVFPPNNEKLWPVPNLPYLKELFLSFQKIRKSFNLEHQNSSYRTNQY